MKMYSIMFFMICMNVAAFILTQSGAAMTGSELTYNPESILATFNLDQMWVGLGIGGAAAGFLAFATHSLIFSTVALMMAWVIINVVPIVEWVVAGVPLMLGILLPAELWYISVSVRAFFAIIFFFFILEIMSQRRIT